jgi:hypothetical protein
MPSVSFNIDQRRFNDAVSEYLTRVPMLMDDAITLRIRRLLMKVSRFLPPKSYKQGRTRVGIDLTKAALPMNADNMQSAYVRRILEERDLVGLQRLVANSTHPKMVGRTAVAFSSRLHDTARNSKGRVDNNQMQITPDFQGWESHLKGLQQDVGMLKGIIAAGMARVGGSSPSWMARHAGNARIVDNRRHRGHPQFSVTSTLTWSGFYQWAVQRAYRSEEHAMMGDLRRRLREAARQSGF